ncbi:MAG: FmdB family zinc ribbon protein [Planctomycetota bacterium]
MPLLEYRCRDCGHVTEVLVKADAGNTPACEECEGENTERVLSPFSARIAPEASPSAGCSSCPDDSCPMRS